jgi:DNA-binding NarL/FixJ family response regulator
MNDIIRVVIVDDHPMFRESIAHLLEIETDMVLMGQGATAEDAVRLTRDLGPDILLLDISMPGGGLNSAQIVNTDYPKTKVIMLTGSADEDHIERALQAGARAYVLKGISGRDLLRVIRRISAGRTYLAPVKPRGRKMNGQEL